MNGPDFGTINIANRVVLKDGAKIENASGTSLLSASGASVGSFTGSVNALAGTMQVPAMTAPVNAVASVGTLTLGGGGATIADGKKVTIDTKVYTFKATLTPTEGEVLIGASDTAALVNLLRAIMHTGTANTDYKCAAVHPTVSATSSNATTLVVAAKTKGVAGDAIATTTDVAGASWGAVTLASGVDGTPAAKNAIGTDGTDLFIAVDVQTISDANWRKVSLGSAY